MQIQFVGGTSREPACIQEIEPKLPATQVAYLVTKQNLVFNHDVKYCVTRDNVPVSVRVSSVIRVLGDVSKGEDTNLVRKFVYELGVRGLESQLTNSLVRQT